MNIFILLTLQAFTEEHPNLPPLVHGSVKEMLTDTFSALVKDLSAVISAVGGTVSAHIFVEQRLFQCH